MQIPWPDKAVLLISGYVRGDDERGRIIRRTLARYLVLMQVLTFQAVSTSGKRGTQTGSKWTFRPIPPDFLRNSKALTFSSFRHSSPVRRRFPTLDHIQEVGLFTAEERMAYVFLNDFSITINAPITKTIQYPRIRLGMAYDEIIGTHGKWWVSETDCRRTVDGL